MAYLNTEQIALRYGWVKFERDDEGQLRRDRQGRPIEVPDLGLVQLHLRRHRVPTFRAGRKVLVREIDIEKSLTPGPVLAHGESRSR